MAISSMMGLHRVALSLALPLVFMPLVAWGSRPVEISDNPEAWGAFDPSKPGYWLHIPKTGTSFGLSLISYATNGAAFVNLTDSHLSTASVGPQLLVLHYARLHERNLAHPLYHRCDWSVFANLDEINSMGRRMRRMCTEGLGGHQPVPDGFSGNVFTILREPKARMVSYVRYSTMRG